MIIRVAQENAAFVIARFGSVLTDQSHRVPADRFVISEQRG